MPAKAVGTAARQATCRLLCARDLVAHAVVLFLHLLNLLLEVLHVAVLGSELVLELANLAGAALDILETLALLGGASLALVLLELLLKAEDIEDHNVGTVEDEGEEQGETAEVHVALGVELAGLNLHTLDTTKASLSVILFS